MRLLCSCVEASLKRVLPEVRGYLEQCVATLRRFADGAVIHPERLECDTVVTAQFLTMACGGHAGTQAVCALVEGAGYAALAADECEAAHAALGGVINALRRDRSLCHVLVHLSGDPEVEGGRLRAETA